MVSSRFERDPPSKCMHRILLEDGHKPYVNAQRRLNPTMKEVVRKEVLKWLDAGVIYLISNSLWVSPVQVVPKKGRTTVIKTENNTFLPSRIVMGVENLYRVLELKQGN